MTDTALLKSLLVLKHITVAQLAKMVGMSTASMSYKINNRRDFSIQEVDAIRRALGLNAEERDAIFFADKVDLEATNNEVENG